jgi:hypothetical protein
MSSNTDKNNKSESTIDRYYHDTESFLYRYRWWVVLVLALLLGWYLYCKKPEGGSGTASTSSMTTQSRGVLGPNDLVVASPASIGGTDMRRLFKL